MSRYLYKPHMGSPVLARKSGPIARPPSAEPEVRVVTVGISRRAPFKLSHRGGT